ncbi:hypothetical protein GF327_00435 [Candidatus Woesearchaeota archaeon]|nr:hypothetical protein [Candidatus Woesearchaeota archaeon]
MEKSEKIKELSEEEKTEHNPKLFVPSGMMEAMKTSQALAKSISGSGILKSIQASQNFAKSISESGVLKQLSLAQSQMDQLLSPMKGLGYIDHNPQDQFSPMDLLKEVSKKQSKLILFDIFPISQSEEIDAYCQANFGETLFFKNDSRAKDSLQQSMKTISNANMTIARVQRIDIHSAYHFGDYFTILFECTLNPQNDETGESDQKILNKRHSIFDQVQTGFEAQLPNELKGIFTKELYFDSGKHSMPSIKVYDIRDYSFFFEDRKSSGLILNGPGTNREKAEDFVNHLSDLDDKGTIIYDNSKFLGFRQEILFGVIGKDLIISQINEYLQDSSKPIPYKYVILNFNEEKLLPFCYEFVSKYYLFIAFELLLLKIKGIEYSKFMTVKDDILDKKDSFLEEKINLTSLVDQFEMYRQIYLQFIKEEFLFENEEAWTYNYFAKSGSNRDSISNYFQDYNQNVVDEFNRKNKRLMDKQKDVGDLIRHQEQLKANQPVINPLFKEVEKELVHQIQKWKDTIDKNQIEAWLYNFETAEDKRIALNLLDKLQHVSSKQLIPGVIATNHKINSLLGDDAEKVYSAIGKITSGSHHSLRIFQENCKLPEKAFTEFSKLEQTKEKVLVLFDDFIGTGKTFIKFYEKNKAILKGFKKVVYACPFAFKKGVNYIQEKSEVLVVYSQLIPESQQVDQMEGLDSDKVIKFIDKYKNRIPDQYRYGYDECKIVFTFENNIPNNTIGLFWYSENWIPLLQRK